MTDVTALEWQVEDLKAQLDRAREELKVKDLEMAEARSTVESAKAEAVEAREHADNQEARAMSLQRELEQQKMCGELAKFRALEDLRAEHKRELEREEELRASEQRRMDALLQEVKNSHLAEKEHLRLMAALEKNGSGRSADVGVTTSPSVVYAHRNSELASSSPAAGGVDDPTTRESVSDGLVVTAVSSHDLTPTGGGSAADTSLAPVTSGTDLVRDVSAITVSSSAPAASMDTSHPIDLSVASSPAPVIYSTGTLCHLPRVYL